MKRSTRTILKNFGAFLILSVATACASASPGQKFDDEWEFIVNPKGEKKACLGLEATKKLRETLIRCK